MTGFKSKREMAEDKLLPQKDFGDALTIAYQSGYYDGKKAAQPAQEPVAWCSQCGHKCPLPAQEPDTYRSVPHGHCTHPRCKEVFSAYIEVNKRLAHYEPEGKSPMILNAAPPQRQWVGLTDKEAQLIYDMGRTPTGMMEMVEAKLKDKNNG